MKRVVLSALYVASAWLVLQSAHGLQARNQTPAAVLSSSDYSFTPIFNAPDMNALLADINRVRLKNNLNPLNANAALEDIAIKRSTDMAANNYYAHKSAVSGNYYYDLLEQQGQRQGFSCENLNLTQSNQITSYTQDWLKSNDHKKCMLDTRITKAGFSVARTTLGKSDSPAYAVVTIYQE